MPGRLDRLLGRNTMARCAICGGVDLLSLGFIHHEPDCPRAPCQFCQNPVEYGQAREVYHGRTAHLDCRIDFENSPAGGPPESREAITDGAPTTGEGGQRPQASRSPSPAGDLSEHLDQEHDADEGRPWI